MPSPSVETFLASLKRCLAAPGFLESFYDRFVGSSEEVREKFRNTDMKRQARVLEESLYVVANAVQGEENSLARAGAARARGPARPPGPRHPPRPLRPVDRVPRRDGAGARPAVRPAVEAAWRETLAFGADYMRQRR